MEEHKEAIKKDDKGFLNLFNKKYISEQRRNDIYDASSSLRPP